MFDTKRAAEYFIVAWCKEWTLTEYLKVVLERPKLCEFGQGEFQGVLDEACAAYPWLPKDYRAYPRTVRVVVGATYPKLSAWLFARNDDVARLKCAPQVEKLCCPEKPKPIFSDADRTEFKAARAGLRQATTSWRAARDAFKTNQRSAWNVCKA